jgi:hypothetical protein
MNAAPERGHTLRIIEERGTQERKRSKGAVIARVGEQIRFDLSILDTFDVKGWQPLHYDLLLVAAAVEFADRRWKRPSGWSRRLDITMPVIELDVWQREDVQKSLEAVLRHLTCDTWRFTFVQSKDSSPIGSRQAVLPFKKTKTFAIAYSDGLDSRATSALSGDKEKALRIRIAGNRNRRRKAEDYFTQIPFKVNGHGGHESSFRTRGFKFSAVTAVVAHLSEISQIVVPESGQGALGPVLLPLHNIYADYRNHPTFFRKMERFINALLSCKVRYEQPRLWHTKGRTLRAFLELPGTSEENLTDTRSCWQTRRVVNMGSRKQCGLCAACLLRQLSMHAAGINEAPDTYVVAKLGVATASEALSVIPQQADRKLMIEYGSVGARHLQQLADMAKLPDQELKRYAVEIAEANGADQKVTLQNLRALLMAHASEWESFLAFQGKKSFLNQWLEGGRHG